MTRKLCTGGAEARADLGAGRFHPAWLSSRHALPFQDLSDGEFEVFCYLLLLHEHPDERIIYHGKTGDAGRDIVRATADGTVELIQCKRYTRNVAVGEVRKELAKLCINVARGVIPVRPTRVAFYAVPDLTNPAKDLLASQAEWLKVCDADLEAHLGEPPSAELRAFAQSWWPQFEHEEDTA